MESEIIADEPLAGALERQVRIHELPAACYIVAESLLGRGGRGQFQGFDIALERAATGKPVVVMTMMPDQCELFMLDPRFHALRGYRNVQFLRLPCPPQEVDMANRRISARTGVFDPLAIALLSVKDPEDALGALKHDLKSPADEPRILKQARVAGYGGSDEAILAAIRTNQPTPLQPFAGQHFPDVFCDIEGTLLIDGKINKRVVSYLKMPGLDRPITLWTGGDVKAYRKQLAKQLPYKVVSKWLFGGATVARVIDDESKDSLESTYDLKIEEHISASIFGQLF